MYQEKKVLTIRKENWEVSYIISLFSIINEASHGKKITILEDKIIIRKKSINRIFEFPPHTMEILKNKIFENFFKNPKLQSLRLTHTESDLLRECADAVYHF